MIVAGLASRQVDSLPGFGVAVLVELSQLWKPSWLEDLRENDLVALAIGRGWVWGDLVRYAFGSALGFGLLRLVERREVVAR